MAPVEWFSSNAASISAFSNIVMVLVWTFYLQLIYQQHRYQRRPRILINLVKTGQISVTNMGQESIYLQSVQSVLRHDDQETLTDLTDRVQENRINAKQGTLEAGHAWEIGSVQVLLEEVAGLFQEPKEVSELEVRAVALYGSEESPVGASRTFAIERKDEEFILTAGQPDTEDYCTREERDEVQRWLRHSLKETAVSVPVTTLRSSISADR